MMQTGVGFSKRKCSEPTCDGRPKRKCMATRSDSYEQDMEAPQRRIQGADPDNQSEDGVGTEFIACRRGR